MTDQAFAAMNKAQLRAACKLAGIKGWGNMDNAKMRAALEGKRDNVVAAVEAVGDTTPAKSNDDPLGMVSTLNSIASGAQNDSPEAQETNMATKAKKPKTPKATKPKSDKPSVRTWLEKRVAQFGSVKVQDAKDYVKETGRSIVTMYRQAQELNLKIDREKKVFVPAKS